eukprot:2418366-Pleurochrysis_carterae.AAC.1
MTDVKNAWASSLRLQSGSIGQVRAETSYARRPCFNAVQTRDELTYAHVHVRARVARKHVRGHFGVRNCVCASLRDVMLDHV